MSFDRSALGAAISIAVTMAVAVLLFMLYPLLGDPFLSAAGLSIGGAAILSGVLATRLYVFHRFGTPRRLVVATAIAWAGVTVVCHGSYLAIAGSTAWHLIVLDMAFGWAMIGLWLLALVESGRLDVAGYPTVRLLALAASIMMLTGFLVIPGIIGAVEKPVALLLVKAGQISWLGTIVVYPPCTVLLAMRVRVSGYSRSPMPD